MDARDRDINSKGQMRIFESNPEVRSFVYQQLMDFEPYLTSNTTLSVITKNPMDLKLDFEFEGKSISSSKLKQMNRILISISEENGKIEAEGLHENIYEAVVIAKERLLEKLREIHDTVVSNQDRLIQIDQVKNQSNMLH